MTAVLHETVLNNRWIPAEKRQKLSLKQAQFLVWPGLEALYGGAGGGGKSICLLMGALQYVDDPDYSALILRRTYQQLAKSEAIMDLAKDWLGGTDARWNEQYKVWRFPSGATVEFGHMEDEKAKYNYQGPAYRYVAFDELTQFTESQYRYLFSRVRQKPAPPGRYHVPLRVRSASNPGGVGHSWVKARFVDAEQTGKLRFFRARLEDNKSAADGTPNIDVEAYRASLAELPELERLQIENGDWDAAPGGRFKTDRIGRYTWEPFSPSEPYGQVRMPSGKLVNPWHLKRVITVDPASTVKRTNDPTVISTFCQPPTGEAIWLGCVRDWIDLPDIVPRLEREARRWKAHEVCIEAVASNNAIYKLARRTAMPVRAVSPLGNEKLVRATPAIAYCDDGRILIPRGDPLFPVDEVIGELSRYTGDESLDAHDDVVDSLSYYISRIREAGGTGTGAAPSAAGRMAKAAEERRQREENPDVPAAGARHRPLNSRQRR